MELSGQHLNARLYPKLAFLIMIFWPWTSTARLGETPIQFADRYGSPQKKPTFSWVAPILKNAEIRYYEKGGWKITAAFTDIVSPSICVEFKKSNAADLTSEEVKTILNANSSSGSEWKQVLYKSRFSANSTIQDISMAAAAPAFGMIMWRRTDGAIARLEMRKVLRLESPEAKKHEEDTKKRAIEKTQANRPKF